MPLDQYRGYRIRTDYTGTWTALVFEPGQYKPHPVILRSSSAEGEAGVCRQAKLLIDELEKRRLEEAAKRKRR